MRTGTQTRTWCTWVRLTAAVGCLTITQTVARSAPDVTSGLLGEWTLHSGGKVGTADEGRSHYRGWLRLEARGGQSAAALSLGGRAESLSSVKITPTSVSFDRKIGQGIVQRYSGSVRNAGSIRGTFTHQNDRYCWWAERKAPELVLALTYPAGESPMVFTTGWIFGAKCVVAGKDVSSQVAWSGSGTFKPRVGARSRPSFARSGPNRIVLTVSTGGRKVSKEFRVVAVSPEKYAAVGDASVCPADSHGCQACPHQNVGGLIREGSRLVLVRGKGAARVGDSGTHMRPCCGPNTFRILAGDSRVLIDGRPAARFGDKTQHCGGIGRVCTVQQFLSAGK